MKILFTTMLITACTCLEAQENEHGSIYQQQLEQQAAQEGSETEDDAYWQHLELRRKHRLNLNRADREALRELSLLTDWQIDNLMQYRQLLGRLLSIYELQAIPGWDLETIRNVLPFVTVRDESAIPPGWRNWFVKGENRLLFRFAQVLEKAKGFLASDSGSHYPGSPLKVLFRYRYQYRDQLQYGITGDKDAGEQFFAGKQRYGFDFYSFHFFVRRLGFINAFALGDFIINLGQGLVHWQGQAFKKSAAVLSIKRQSPVLKPYSAAGEFNFHRGAAISVQQKNLHSTIFASFRKWTAAVQEDEEGNQYINSVQFSGYHRSGTEQRNRNSLNVFAAGACLQLRGMRGQISFNSIYHSFSIPFRASGDAYDLYALKGKNWFNSSIDYSYTYANFHVYGEMGVDKNFNAAMIHGLLVSAGAVVDLSLVYRRISPAYQAMTGNAFTENTQPVNENGIYGGISVRPAYGWRIDAYADFFRFPWLKFQVDAPSDGCDYLLQVTFTPNKQTEIYSRFRVEEKGMNLSGSGAALPAIGQVMKKNWRSQVSFQPAKQISLANRVEILWYTARNTAIKKTGFLFFQDFQYAPVNRPWKAALRLQYFESDDYDTRLYAYENSVMYNFSLPAFFNKGVRWYATVQYKLSISNVIKGPVSCIAGLNISRSSYAAGTEIGSGQDLLPGSDKTEWKLQAIFSW
jgi:hypothetical protein